MVESVAGLQIHAALPSQHHRQIKGAAQQFGTAAQFGRLRQGGGRLGFLAATRGRCPFSMCARLG